MRSCDASYCGIKLTTAAPGHGRQLQHWHRDRHSTNGLLFAFWVGHIPSRWGYGCAFTAAAVCICIDSGSASKCATSQRVLPCRFADFKCRICAAGKSVRCIDTECITVQGPCRYLSRQPHRFLAVHDVQGLGLWACSGCCVWAGRFPFLPGSPQQHDPPPQLNNNMCLFCINVAAPATALHRCCTMGTGLPSSWEGNCTCMRAR